MIGDIVSIDNGISLRFIINKQNIKNVVRNNLYWTNWVREKTRSISHASVKNLILLLFYQDHWILYNEKVKFNEKTLTTHINYLKY